VYVSWSVPWSAVLVFEILPIAIFLARRARDGGLDRCAGRATHRSINRAPACAKVPFSGDDGASAEERRGTAGSMRPARGRLDP
jgi:hypothetical protein